MNHENCEMKIRGKVTELIQSLRMMEEDISWLTVHPGGVQTVDGTRVFPLMENEIRYLVCTFLCASKFRWDVSRRIVDGDRHHFGKEIRITKNTMKNTTIFR